jgi:hypothetical protein
MGSVPNHFCGTFDCSGVKYTIKIDGSLVKQEGAIGKALDRAILEVKEFKSKHLAIAAGTKVGKGVEISYGLSN